VLRAFPFVFFGETAHESPSDFVTSKASKVNVSMTQLQSADDMITMYFCLSLQKHTLDMIKDRWKSESKFIALGHLVD
jgi:hypothetical protein